MKRETEVERIELEFEEVQSLLMNGRIEDDDLVLVLPEEERMKLAHWGKQVASDD